MSASFPEELKFQFISGRHASFPVSARSFAHPQTNITMTIIDLDTQVINEFIDLSPVHFLSNYDGGVGIKWSDIPHKNVNLKTETYTGNECTCSLCLEDICNESDIHRLTCNHIFHAHNCLGNRNIKDWINDHGTCPYCRTKIHNLEPNNELDSEEIETVMDQIE